MAVYDFIPARDVELLTWSGNFREKVVADAPAYGLTAAQASAYAARHDAYAAAFGTASAPATRTSTAVLVKDEARAALEAEARGLSRIVQAAPGVTAEHKLGLGLTVRDTKPSPVPPPGGAPSISILAAVGRTVRLRLMDRESTRRGKPAGVIGAVIFSCVGDNPPASLSDWRFEGTISQVFYQVHFPASVPNGATVHLRAQWLNRKLQPGPASSPAWTNIPGDVPRPVSSGLAIAA